MKESYGEGVATHTDPESCGAVRKERVEALTGERAGRVLSRVRKRLRGADAVQEGGRQQPSRRYRETPRSPARSIDPVHARTHHAWEPGGPRSARGNGTAGRVGKPKGDSQR